MATTANQQYRRTFSASENSYSVEEIDYKTTSSAVDEMKGMVDLVLSDLQEGSVFFSPNDDVMARVPRFDPDEAETGKVLGMGQFGVVLNVTRLSANDEREAGSDASTIAKEEELVRDFEKSMHADEKKIPRQPSIVVLNQASIHDVRTSLAPEEFKRTDSADERTLSTLPMDNASGGEDEYEEDPLLVFGSDEEVNGIGDGNSRTPHSHGSALAARARLQSSDEARYVLKKLHFKVREDIKLDAVLDLVCEATFLASMSHPNIVRLRGTVGNPGSHSFGMILEKLTMTLDQKIVRWKQQRRRAAGTGCLLAVLPHRAAELRVLLTERLAAALDVARGLRYLHSWNLVYRDVKPENIGYDLQGILKIFDFGLTKELKAADLVEPPDGYNATGLTGSRRYMAPEVTRCLPYGLSADVYSFGILLWEIVALETPFLDYDASKHYDLVVAKGKRPRRLRNVPKVLSQLIDASWSEDRQKRPSLVEICQVLETQVSSLETTAEGAAAAAAGAAGGR